MELASTCIKAWESQCPIYMPIYGNIWQVLNGVSGFNWNYALVNESIIVRESQDFAILLSFDSRRSSQLLLATVFRIIRLAYFVPYRTYRMSSRRFSLSFKFLRL